MDLVHPYPEQDAEEERRAQPFLAGLAKLLREKVDSDRIDREGEIPDTVIQGLRELGAFGIKIPREYGGLRFLQLSGPQASEAGPSLPGPGDRPLSAPHPIRLARPAQNFRPGAPPQQ